MALISPRRLKLAAAIPAAAVQQVFLRKSRRDILRISVLLQPGGCAESSYFCTCLVLHLRLRRTTDQINGSLGAPGVVGNSGQSGDESAASVCGKLAVNQNAGNRVNQSIDVTCDGDVAGDICLGIGPDIAIHQIVHEVDSGSG